MPKAEYRLSPSAERDLENIFEYTTKQWGLDQANLYIDRLISVFEELSTSPSSVPACDHIRPGYRRRLVEKHIVYFRITDYGIAVIRILHERMNVKKYL